MKDTKARVIYNEKVNGDYFKVGLDVGWKGYQPGQFVMLEVPGGETFLRRPFSIALLEDGKMEIVYKVIGRGTKKLSKMEKGTSLSVLGPLGKGFDIPRDSEKIFLIAGGYGFAPLFGLAKSLVGREVSLFYGAKTSGDLIYTDKFRDLKLTINLSTEDGSAGEAGLITELLEKRLKSSKSKGVMLACGPEGMLKSIAKLSVRYKIPAQVSLESYMACGIGVCLGCVVKDSKGEYKSVCREGPVFDVKKVEF